MPETPTLSSPSGTTNLGGGGGGGGVVAAAAVGAPRAPRAPRKCDADGHTRTAREKQKLLGKYLRNVQDLVEDLKETTPFGTAL